MIRYYFSFKKIGDCSPRSALNSEFNHKSADAIFRSLENYKRSSGEQVKAWATSTLEVLNLRVALHALRENKDGGLIDAQRAELGIATAPCVCYLLGVMLVDNY
jgi:hypothetical protein